MSEKVLKGRRVCKGKAEGEALVSQMPISFMTMMDAKTGVIQANGHDLEGMSVVGKILVFPIYRGSSADPYSFLELVRCKTQPKGIINVEATHISAVGAVMGNIPMMDKLDGNPLELIKTGDFVELDADQGIVKIRPRDSLTTYPENPALIREADT